jgi:hypothetical protein
MTLWLSRRTAVRGVCVFLILLLCVLALAAAEQRRTESELAAVVSAYLSDGILQDAHDWGSGRSVLVVLQREAQVPGMRRWRWLSPFDNRLKFNGSSVVTRSSFSLSNALPSRLQITLQLPAGVTSAVVSRKELERGAGTDEFQKRFPNSLGYVVVSQAGFNFNKSEAIFYIDHFCGLCGGGRYVLMRKTEGTWKVVDEHYTWVS